MAGLTDRQVQAGANVSDKEIEYWAEYGVKFNRIGHMKNSSKKGATAATEEHQNGDRDAITRCRGQVRQAISSGRAKFGGSSYEEDYKGYQSGKKTAQNEGNRQAKIDAWKTQADPKILKKAQDEMKSTGKWPAWAE